MLLSALTVTEAQFRDRVDSGRSTYAYHDPSYHSYARRITHSLQSAPFT
jgi:hypothetical protein